MFPKRMVVIPLPDWYGAAHSALDETISQIAREQNINEGFVNDSSTIQESTRSILESLVAIQEGTKEDNTNLKW